MAEPDRVSGSSSVAMDEGRARRRPTRAPKEPEVVVEPDQAELLAELSRRTWGVRQAPPGTTISAMSEAELPQYHGEWAAVAGVPGMEQYVPIGER
jgi:hypothetical protein